MTAAITIDPRTLPLTDEDAHTLGKLIAQYNTHLNRNVTRSNYFEGKHKLRRLGLTLPAQLRDLDTVVGWPTQAVTTLEQRLDLDGFVRAGQAETDTVLEEIFTSNNMAIEASQAHTAALVHGTSFVAVTAPAEPGDPAAVITVHSALQATGLWDARHRCLSAGLIVERHEDSEGAPRRLVILARDHVTTILLGKNTRPVVETTPHALGRVPMVALSHQPWLEKPFGVSRISRAVMSMTDQAVRCIMRTEAASEFFSFPQRYILGVDKESAGSEMEMYMNRFLAFEKDEDGDLPKIDQLNGQGIQPHIDELRSIAMMFSGETGIPPSFLGIIHDNPASADAIRAGEAKLVKIAERDQVIFGARWCEVANLALHIATGENANQHTLRARWKDASTPTKAAQAQSVMQLVSAGILPPTSEITYELLGYDSTTISRLVAEAKRREADDMFASLLTQTEEEIDQHGGIGEDEAWPHEAVAQ